jgi:hypothetical protein
MSSVVIVGMPELVELFGVEPETVRMWRVRDALPPEDLKFGREPAWMLSSILRHREQRRNSAADIKDDVLSRLRAGGIDGPAVLLGTEHIGPLVGRTVAGMRMMYKRGQLPPPDLRIGSKAHRNTKDGEELHGTPVWRLSTITLWLAGELPAKPPRGLAADPVELARLHETNRVA